MTDLTDLVRRGTVSELYQRIKKTVLEVERAPRPSKATRMAKWAKKLDEMSVEDLARLEIIMESFVSERFAKVQVTEVRLLAQEEVDKMAAEYKDMEVIRAALDARHGELKRMVFTHINVENVDSEDPPEVAKGAVVSEKEGIAFKREGGNRGDPTILWDKLKANLPEDVWKKLVHREVIPEQVIESPREELLLDLVESGEIDIEVLRPYIQPGVFGSVSFRPRIIK